MPWVGASRRNGGPKSAVSPSPFSTPASQPLAGARVFVELVRPVEKRPPLAVAMEAADIGRFAGRIELPERGNWDLDIVVERGGERYALTRRMFLK